MPDQPAAGRPARRRGWWRRGWVLVVLTAAVIGALGFHGSVTNRGNLGSLLETFLPWLGLAAVPLGIAALVRRSAPALLAVAALTALWLAMFATTLWPKSGNAGELRVLTHNVSASNLQPRQTAEDVLGAKADIVALEELTSSQLGTYEHALASTYRHSEVHGTVGLWSRYPIRSVQPLDLGLSWARALRTVVATPEGDVAVYVVHLASVRVGVAGFRSSQRNKAITLLTAKVRADPVRDVIVMGDFNGSAYDRALAPLTEEVHSAQRLAGDGFGFSWPAFFPMARIDQILVRGLHPTRAWVLPRTGSDHRPVAADFDP